MRKQKKGFTVVELVVVIAIIAVLAAVLIPTFTSIIKKANDSAYLQERTNQQLQDLIEKVENQNYLTWEDFEAKLAIAIANSEKDNSEKITQAVKDALSGISGAGLTKEQVEKIVEKALEGQLTVTQVEAIVYNAINGISASGLTQSEVKAIVNNAIRNIPQTGVTKEQVTAAINSAIAGLTDAQKQAITAAVNSALEKFTSEAITAEDVQKIVEAVINGQSSKITLTLNKDNLSLNVGASETLVATVTPEGTEIGWASSDTSVATVSKNGTVTAVAAGNATITVTAGGATVKCAVTVVTAPVEVHLTGDIRELREEDHKWNVDGSQYSGQTIGKLKLENGMAYSYLAKDGSAGTTYTIHEFELVYTIPENTPQNAIIICDPITEQQYANAVNYLIQPGVSIGYTYKIINESSYDFNITGTEYDCDKIKALSTSDTIVDYKNGDYVLLNSLDNTFYTLTSDNIPNITTGGYMSQYLTWLNSKTTTGYSTVNSGFLEKYKTDYSQTDGQRLIDFINEKVANGTPIDTILDSMSGSNAGNDTKIKHVEGEVIKLLLDFHYRKPVGIVFVKNTKNGWLDNAAVTLSKTMDYTITEFKDWSDFATSGLTVYSAFDLLNNTNVLSYDKIGNTIVGSVIEMWNSFAGNAWQGTTVFSGPIFRITLTANN